MHAVGNDNETGYEATSGNARLKNGPEADLDYLAGEAQAARVAMRASLSELKATLLCKINPRQFTRQHPRVAVGVAVAAGVTAGITAASLVAGRRAQRPAEAAPTESSCPDDSLPHGWISTGLAKLFELAGMALRPALWGMLQLAIRSGMAAWNAPPAGPGEAPAGPANPAAVEPPDNSADPDLGPAACSADASPGCNERRDDLS